MDALHSPGELYALEVEIDNIQCLLMFCLALSTYIRTHTPQKSYILALFSAEQFPLSKVCMYIRTHVPLYHNVAWYRVSLMPGLRRLTRLAS